jgi:hypothetical protein
MRPARRTLMVLIVMLRPDARASEVTGLSSGRAVVEVCKSLWRTSDNVSLYKAVCPLQGIIHSCHFYVARFSINLLITTSRHKLNQWCCTTQGPMALWNFEICKTFPCGAQVANYSPISCVDQIDRRMEIYKADSCAVMYWQILNFVQNYQSLRLTQFYRFTLPIRPIKQVWSYSTRYMT